MAIKIWIGSEYGNTHENVMAGDAIAELTRVYEALDEECHVLVNFKIPGDPPRHPGEHRYVSEIDLAILRPKNLVVVDMKNYEGAIEYGDACQWICHAPDGDVTIHGGREGRTPHGQLCDYRRQMIALLSTNLSLYLNPRRHPRSFDVRRFVSGMVLFPDCEGAIDIGHFETECGRWLSVKRMGDFAEAICGQCGGRDADLDGSEMAKLVTQILRLSPAHMVGRVPKAGAVSPVSPVIPQVKIVTVERPVEVRVEVPKIVRDEYGAIMMAYESDDANAKKISDMSDIFRRLVYRERKRKFKETQVRSLGTAAELLLKDDADLSRCAILLFRLSAAVHKNPDLVVSSADVDDTFKTLCRVAEKLSGEPMPVMIREKCDGIVYSGRIIRYAASNEGLKTLFLEVVSTDDDSGVFTGVVRDDEARTEYVVKLPDFDLRPGMVVCAITPRKVGDVWEASEIILEPDYLISPQSIGRAAVYSKPELYYWLNAIRDDPSDKYRVPGSDRDGPNMQSHILLGNFANECLAEHCADGRRAIDERIRSFCVDSGLDFTDANPPGPWFTECRHEDANIVHVLHDTLPNEHQIANRSWQIEAPLYSPQFGLSARADALSYANDRSSAIVLELKSGKWETFRADSPKEEHVCQPSFYADILGFSAGLRREAVLPFLYYAKTIPATRWDPERNGRLFLRPSVNGLSVGGLVRHYSRVRNSIVSIDRLARTGMLRNVIDNSTADIFRNPTWDVNGRMWLEFKRPELESLLSPFHTASEIEKRYLYRMLQFVAEESFVSRIGDADSEIGRGGESMLWRLPVNKRQTTGMRLSELVRLDRDEDMDDLGRVVRITFDTTRNRNNSGCSVRQGDGVVLYADSPEANITNSIVFGASVESLAPGSITLLLDNPQPQSLLVFGPTARFAVEAAPMTSMKDYKALWHFLTGDSRRRELVLNTTVPSVDASAVPPIPIQVMEQRYPGVSSWLGAAWRAKDWYLIWGPPGTGKTSHAMRALVDEAMAVPGMKILLLAYTYKATDKICEMLERRIHESNGELYLRIGNAQKCDAAYRARIPEQMNLPNRVSVRATIENTRIFVSTVSTLGPRHAICGLVKHFDLAIVDEASQLLDTHILPLFCAKRQDDRSGPLVGKFILIGDDKQLPAVVQQSEQSSRIDDDNLKFLGFQNCRESFFSRLKRLAGSDSNLCGMLDTQFRMHPMIADFCNEYFYEGRLNNGNAPRQLSNLPPVRDDATPFVRYVLGTRLGFFPVDGDRRSGGKVSRQEAKVCVDIIRTLLAGVNRPNADDPNGQPIKYEPKDIGIIVPFRNQIACLREAVGEMLGIEAASAISIDTVERNQGGERPVVLFSTVITSADQADWISAKRYDDDDDGDEMAVPIDRKLNVAITRAQERFYLVGDERVLNNLRAYGDLLRWITDHSGFCEYDAKMVF